MATGKLLTRPRAESKLNRRPRPKLVALVDQQIKAYASAGAVPRTSIHAAFQHWYKKQDLRGFLDPLLPPDALAFDVGANVGQWTIALRSLDCRVVAVEPQEGCAAEISQAHVDHPDVHVVVEAVGAARGAADLFLAQTSSEHASMAPDWMNAMRQSGRMPDTAWTAGTVRVPVTTLDLLIERYGMPDLLKLDIEGLEPEALEGLSTPPAAVLFEFHYEALVSTRRSVERLEELGSYEFNYTVGEWLSLQRSRWTSRSELLSDLEELGTTGWGNVVARQRSSAAISTR